MFLGWGSRGGRDSRGGWGLIRGWDILELLCLRLAGGSAGGAAEWGGWVCLAVGFTGGVVKGVERGEGWGASGCMWCALQELV